MRKMEKKKEKEEEQTINIFAFDYFDCEEKLLDSGTIFNIKVAKCFNL